MTDDNILEIPDRHSTLGGVDGEAEKLLSVLSADMHEYAIFALDAQGRVSSWNAGAQRMKGYLSEEIIGRHFSTFYPSEQVDAGHPEWELAQAAANGFLIDHGWRLRKDGSRFWAHVVITAQRTTDGSLDGFIKVTRDDTEVRARQHRSRKRFTDLLEVAPVAIAVLDESDLLLDANGALSDLLGYRLRDLYGRSAAELLHPSDQAEGLVPHPSRPNVSGAAGPQPLPHRVLVRSDGQSVFCQVRSEASVQDDGTRFWLTVFQDVTEQVRHTQTLHHQATHDDRTGLLNRQGVKELLAPLLTGDGDENVAVLFCDLDNFKRVNDSLGHEAGDELLVALAQRLTHELPADCTPARLYGDEFLIVCSAVKASGGLDSLTRTAAQLLRTVVPLRGRLINISASIGAAVVENPGMTSDDLVRLADTAMFEAKAHGHGLSSHARAPTTRAMTGQLALEEELRQAISHDRLTLHYQPIVNGDRDVILAEALVRWPHPRRGLLAPDVILSVAEQGGLLHDLDRWVLRSALREAASWSLPVGITVNLSALKPTTPHFFEEVTTAISDSGIGTDRVVLEMVETALVDLPSTSYDTISDLSATGVRFAMDDFGTGYSSLARLKDLPTQIIKLDRRFVSGMGTDPADLGIARAVVELARAMGRTCIAEGVETTTQYRLLQGLGIDACQGFLLSVPLPAAEFRTLLTHSPLPQPSDEEPRRRSAPEEP